MGAVVRTAAPRLRQRGRRGGERTGGAIPKSRARKKVKVRAT